jgi:hypothetical protein
MHIARETPEELVVVSGSRWVSAICATGAILYTYFAITRHLPKAHLLVTAFLVLFALIMDLRKTFIFDGRRRIVRWQGRTVFKAESGEISFDDITDIGMESRHSGRRDVLVYRLTNVTPRATIPWHTPTTDDPTVTPLFADRF